MERNQLIKLVAERGSLPDEATAERATKATYHTLAERIVRGEATDLAAQLPGDLAEALRADRERETFGLDEFVRRVCDRSGLEETDAVRAVQAVFAATAEAVTASEYEEVVSQLPEEYEPLLSMAGRGETS